MLNSRKIKPVCLNLGASMVNSTINIKAYVSDDHNPWRLLAGSSTGCVQLREI
jgi:hypothetical protein